MLRPENFGVFPRGLLGCLQIILHDRLRNTSGQTRRERNQTLMMLAKQLHIDARPVIEALGKAK